MSADPVRRLALDVLVDVGAGEALTPRLEAALARCTSARDGAFLSELVRGTLCLQGRYDHLVRRLSHRRGLPDDERLRALLRLGLHQLLDCAGVPAYAAVHTTVGLCRHEVAPGLAAYVNALLQNVARQLGAEGAAGGEPPAGLRAMFPDPEREPAAFLAGWHSHPRWLVERWLSRWGYAETEALCRHDNLPAPVTLHVLAPHAPEAAAARLAAAGWPATPGRIHPRALILGGRPSRPQLRALLAAEPALLVQDEGAQAACAWLAAGPAPGPGAWADLCAAPGGKTFHLRALWPGAGPAVACDWAPERLARLVENGKRIEGGMPLVVRADAAAPPLREGCWDAILLDGPCSGTGVLRHHPEGRWRLRPGWLATSGARLGRLAEAAARLLRPGGRLLYVTCSLEPEENEAVIAGLLKAGECVPDPHPSAGEAGAWQRAWLPASTGGDGFFAARLRRREG